MCSSLSLCRALQVAVACRLRWMDADDHLAVSNMETSCFMALQIACLVRICCGLLLPTSSLMVRWNGLLRTPSAFSTRCASRSMQEGYVSSHLPYRSCAPLEGGFAAAICMWEGTNDSLPFSGRLVHAQAPGSYELVPVILLLDSAESERLWSENHAGLCFWDAAAWQALPSSSFVRQKQQPRCKSETCSSFKAQFHPF